MNRLSDSEELRWGFGLPYVITGLLNQHPRAAMEYMAKERKDIVKFYDSVIEEE